jgi:hypothetical protein
MRNRLNSIQRRWARKWWSTLRPTLKALGGPIPIYVTRANADGVIGCWSVGAWFGLVVTLIIMANVLLWSVYALLQVIHLLF